MHQTSKKEGEKFTWFPNNKEKHFIKEAFDLISNPKNCNSEEENYLKFSVNQQTLDDQYKKVEEENLEDINISNEEIELEKKTEITTDEQTQDDKINTKKKTNINEKRNSSNRQGNSKTNNKRRKHIRK